MPGEDLLIGIATVAVAVAGFSAIASALSPSAGTWAPGQRIRLRVIVSTSFNVMFESLLPPVAFPALGDARASLVVSSAVVGVYLVAVVVVRARQSVRAGALAARSTQLILTTAISSIVLFGLDALVFGSLTVYALALLVQLSVAAISFYSLLANMT